MKSEDDETTFRKDGMLQRLHDGELSPAERASVEAALDDEGRRKLAALADLGAAVRGSLRTERDELIAKGPPVDLWAAIAGEIERPAAATAAAPAAAKDAGVGGGKVLPFRQRLKRTLVRAPVWMSSLTAAAAAIAIYLGSGVSAAPSNGCEIDDVDVNGATVTVMKVDDEKGPGTTTVVWLDENENPQELPEVH